MCNPQFLSDRVVKLITMIARPIISLAISVCLFQQVQSIHFESAQIHFNFENIMHQSKNFDGRGRKVPSSGSFVGYKPVGEPWCYQSSPPHTYTHSRRLLAGEQLYYATDLIVSNCDPSSACSSNFVYINNYGTVCWNLAIFYC